MALDELMSDISDSDKISKADAKSAAEKAAADATKAEQDRAAEIVAMCAKANVAHMSAGLIRGGSTIDDAKAKIEAEGGRVAAIKQKVEAAKKSLGAGFDAAAETAAFIANGATAEAAGSALLDKIVAKQDAKPTRSSVAAGGEQEARAKTPNAGNIYAERSKARGKMAITQ